MKLIFAICFFALLISSPQPGYSQREVEQAGVKYILHTVKKSETIYSLCQKYKVTQKEIILANPGLTTILQAGSTVKIPVGKVVAEPAKPEINTLQTSQVEYYYHKVGKRQTIFSIAKQYGITANDLIRDNPELSNGLKIGQILKIPVSITSSASQEADKSPAILSGQEDLSAYTVHPVVSGETLYSLEKRYGITHEEMLKLNPALQYGLKTGMKLKIPVKPSPQTNRPVSNAQSFTKYQVGKGETLFSISSRFGVEVSELKNANPSLFSRSLETGETILIPRYSTLQSTVAAEQKSNVILFEEETDSGNCIPIMGMNTQKYKVALLLPFYLPGNDNPNPLEINKALLLSKISFSNQPDPISSDPISSDTAVMINGVNIDQKALGFLEFYEGALLAIDSLQRLGMNIELYVFDASNQQMINALLQTQQFRDLNLIIGPVYPELQQTVASFAAKNRIPMVSPLSSTGNYEQNNSWYFKVNPTKEFQIEQTATYVADEFSNKNFILLQFSGNSNSGDAQLGKLSKEKLAAKNENPLFHEYNFQQQGVNSIKPLLDKTGENIFIIPTDNEAQVSVAVTNLSGLAEHYDIVLVGTSALPKLKSIQTENYHRIRLRYLSPYFIDYTNPLVRRFVSQYREIYSAEPSQFSYQGFDVSYYFLSALFRYGNDFKNCLHNYPMELTQMVFSFRKVAPMGGFMNQGMFVTGYERNFDVLNYGVVGEYKISSGR